MKRRLILIYSGLWTTILLPLVPAGMIFWHKPLDERGLMFCAFTLFAGFVACLVTLKIAQFFPIQKQSAWFAYLFCFLGFGTLSLTFFPSLIYTYQDAGRFFDPITTIEGVRDILNFTLAHGYTYLVVGARIFIPFGAIGLFVFCFHLSTVLNETKS